MSVISEDIQTHWSVVQPLFSIRDEKEYNKAIATLNAFDEVGTNEQHPLYELLDTLGTVINAYEEEHHPIPECSGVEVLRLLMTEHQLEPTDLPELGPPDTVLEILNGKQDLTVRHIHALAEMFQVSPAVFV